VAVGQGAVTATPIQLARIISGVAMGGVFMQPHLLKNFPNPQQTRFPISEDSVEKITQGMFGVVNEGGTAAGARLQNIEFCGKSGSAQVIGYDTRDRLGQKRRFKDNAWFVGYAPRRNPEIVVAVLVQGGEHGGAVAGPIARDVVKAYYDKKNRRAQERTTAQNSGGEETPKPLLATVGPH
jgi:penicillin-binding protein 2